jgi:hypothetical protein
VFAQIEMKSLVNAFCQMMRGKMLPGRFLASMGCAILLATVLSLLVFSFPDNDLTPYPPTTFFESACTGIWVVIVWPFPIAAFLISEFIGGNGIVFDFYIPLIVTGLFWAFVMEWIFIFATDKWIKFQLNSN